MHCSDTEGYDAAFQDTGLSSESDKARYKHGMGKFVSSGGGARNTSTTSCT